jgi:hypothetical protein
MKLKMHNKKTNSSYSWWVNFQKFYQMPGDPLGIRNREKLIKLLAKDNATFHTDGLWGDSVKFKNKDDTFLFLIKYAA